MLVEEFEELLFEGSLSVVLLLAVDVAAL